MTVPWALIVFLVLGVAFTLYRKWSEGSALKRQQQELARKQADRQSDEGG